MINVGIDRRLAFEFMAEAERAVETAKQAEQDIDNARELYSRAADRPVNPPAALQRTFEDRVIKNQDYAAFCKHIAALLLPPEEQ